MDPYLAMLIEAWMIRYMERGREMAESPLLHRFLLAKDREERAAEREI